MGQGIHRPPHQPYLASPLNEWVPLARVPPAPPVVRLCLGSWWTFVVDGLCPRQGFGFAVDGPCLRVLTGRVYGVNPASPFYEEVLTGVFTEAVSPFVEEVLTDASRAMEITCCCCLSLHHGGSYRRSTGALPVPSHTEVLTGAVPPCLPVPSLWRFLLVTLGLLLQSTAACPFAHGGSYRRSTGVAACPF